MLAIDTNIIVRYLANDHPQQSSKARAVIEGGEIFVATTAFLESEWVLRSVYDFAGVEIAQALRAFAGLANVTVENPSLLAEALDRAEAGMDFADALHLGAAASCEAMVTFDRKFIKSATGTAIQVKAP